MTERAIYLTGAAVLLITALFSVGYHQFDEHFQILEFASEKLGLIEAEHLPWEYHYQTRPSIQPVMVVWVQTVLNAAQVTDPFVIATCLRILSALLSFLSIHLLYTLYRRDIQDVLLQQWFLLLSFFLWFAVYNNVRFASENWSGTVFLIAYCLFFLKPPYRRLHFLSTGLLFGLSFLFRYQVGFLIAGFGAWLFFIKKEKLSHLLCLGSGICVSMAGGILIDSWFYGEWTLTVWNDLEQDLLLGKLSEFGVMPWWFYFKATFIRAIPPFSLVFLLSFLICIVFRNKAALTWTVVPFIAVHSLIGHKETRYLFPLISFAPVWIVQSIEIIQEKLRIDLINHSVFRRCAQGFFIANTVLLLVVMFRPADPNIGLYKTIYDHYTDPVTLYYIGKNPYHRVLDIQYYKRSSLTLQSIRSVAEIDFGRSEKALFVTRKPETLGRVAHEHAEYEYELLYRTLPEWVTMLNFNNWLERTKLWYLYEMRAAPNGERVISAPS